MHKHPKIQTLSVTKFIDGGPIHFQTLEDQKLFLEHKDFLQTAMLWRDAGEYDITITRHKFGMYYTYTIKQSVYVPLNQR